MATVKSMLNLQMHNSTWFALFLSQKHDCCVYSYILMLNESTEYIYVYFKCLNMLFKNQFKMAAVKMANNIFETVHEHTFCSVRKLSEQYYFVQRNILSRNPVINS